MRTVVGVGARHRLWPPPSRRETPQRNQKKPSQLALSAWKSDGWGWGGDASLGGGSFLLVFVKAPPGLGRARGRGRSYIEEREKNQTGLSARGCQNNSLCNQVRKKILTLKTMFLVKLCFLCAMFWDVQIVNLTVGGLSLAFVVQIGRLRTMEKEETSTKWAGNLYQESHAAEFRRRFQRTAIGGAGHRSEEHSKPLISEERSCPQRICISFPRRTVAFMRRVSGYSGDAKKELHLQQSLDFHYRYKPLFAAKIAPKSACENLFRSCQTLISHYSDTVAKRIYASRKHHTHKKMVHMLGWRYWTFIPLKMSGKTENKLSVAWASSMPSSPPFFMAPATLIWKDNKTESWLFFAGVAQSLPGLLFLGTLLRPLNKRINGGEPPRGVWTIGKGWFGGHSPLSFNKNILCSKGLWRGLAGFRSFDKVRKLKSWSSFAMSAKKLFNFFNHAKIQKREKLT